MHVSERNRVDSELSDTVADGSQSTILCLAEWLVLSMDKDVKFFPKRQNGPSMFCLEVTYPMYNYLTVLKKI